MPDYTHIYCSRRTYIKTHKKHIHTRFIDQCIVKESYDCELLYHDCFDENILPCPWKCGTAVDTVLQTQ